MGLTWPKAWRHRTSSPGKAQTGRRRTSKDDFLVGQRRRTEQPDPPGKVSVDDFELLSVIGKGSFAKVLQVRKVDTGKIYAMKILNKRQIVQRRQVAHTRTERNVLADVVKGHPFLVTLRYAFQTPAKLYLVLDYVNGGELFYWLKLEGRFQEDRACFYAAQIVLALEHLHLQGIIYRDLKPENILLDRRGYLRVTDFGLSKVLEPGEKTYSFVGTSEYLSPEVLLGRGYTHAVDWWSLGTLLFEMMAGLPPFYSKSTNVMYDQILHGDIQFPKQFSPDAVDLLKGLLERDPDKRLGHDGAQAIKAHPFFASIDWAALYAKELPAPFKPPACNDLDTTNIDREFTMERPCDSPCDWRPLGRANSTSDPSSNNYLFDGFTYAEHGLEGGPKRPISASLPDR
ncbi:unnamed protein product (mitochondrion) [Plasmodiophora brassicae]|uniref:non-specific serine/threonine protein kinase n=1 Tax=Plasmodiophora brassicae TaxID=37360 RepID=A0A0G4J0F3_PLABS|nr:hypothetical protein PBRA_001810 [Plasmodiophora brassicae]SPQ93762.1 unnamed protein product [Plasmodiophora brassicae]